MSDTDVLAIRKVLAALDPKAASKAAEPLPINELFTPKSHMDALDPIRTLVVGNRGVGKSVWSGVLADENTRLRVSDAYPDIGLDSLEVCLGFHESAAQTDGVAPSPATLSALLSKGVDATDIWLAVLFRALVPKALPNSLKDTVKWIKEDSERAEARLRKVDAELTAKGTTFVLVFDALDRMSNSWETIRTLTTGILKLALDVRGYKSIRCKIFMRTDQFKDDSLFRFPDASKLRSDRVELVWHGSELYGLLFHRLRNDTKSRAPFARFVRRALSRENIKTPTEQAKVFSLIAGEFMGADPRRGRTYWWVIDHLADAFGETTPRNFLVALQMAARSRSLPTDTPIGHISIREGVQAASEVRVDQLREDYPWIEKVLKDLKGLEVPCSPAAFSNRWRERATVKAITSNNGSDQPPGPMGLEKTVDSKPGEEVLLDALKIIGVIEERGIDRINMPDIFRVAAGIKRRGGVRPPIAGSGSD